jgi:endonuclease YncB( thermonuclease family)
VLNEDVITINNDVENKNQTNYVLDEKTGKIKEKKVKNGWLNPADPNKKNDIGHVARVPEINPLNEEENSAKPKRKSFWRDRRDPNNLSVTTGKYKKKKRRKNKP